MDHLQNEITLRLDQDLSLVICKNFT